MRRPNQTSATPDESKWTLEIIISVCLLTCCCSVKPTVGAKGLITGFWSSSALVYAVSDNLGVPADLLSLYLLSSPDDDIHDCNCCSKQQIICRVLQGHPSHMASCYRRASSGFFSHGGWNPSRNLCWECLDSACLCPTAHVLRLMETIFPQYNWMISHSAGSKVPLQCMHLLPHASN